MPGKFNPPTTCLKCGGIMEAGTYIGYKTLPSTGLRAEDIGDSAKWWKVQFGEGGSLLGAKKPGHVLVKPQGDPLLVLHYRCADCGYLESYAPGPLE